MNPESDHGRLPPLREDTPRRPDLGDGDENTSNPVPLPRRSHSERIGHRRPSPHAYDGELPPLPHGELSPEARRQSIMAMDRKRRLTTSSQETGRRRTTTGGFTSRDNRYYPPTQRTASYRPTHSSREAEERDVIDLTSSSPSRHDDMRPPPPPLPHRSSSTGSRSYVVPPWQPDTEVAECPICHRPFGFLFRRHHCRKCGRVVCNDCSPHRITIPRQYIVHPPGSEDVPLTASVVPPTIDLTRGDDEDEERYEGLGTPNRRLHPMLGGGEKVRLCNPCVPDPQPELQAVLREGPMATPYIESREPLRSAPPDMPTFPNLSRYPDQPSDRPLFGAIPHPGRRLHLDDEDDDSASSPEAYSSASTRHHMAMSSNRYPPPAFASAHARYHSLDSRQAPLPPLPPFISRPPNSMLDSFNRGYGAPPPFPSSSNIPVRPSHHAQGSSSSAGVPHPPRPRHRIREEDICPICQCLLPPKGPDNDETDRENHIMACISQHDTTATSPQNRPPPPTPSTSLPNLDASSSNSALQQSQSRVHTHHQQFGASGPTLPIPSSSSSSRQPFPPSSTSTATSPPPLPIPTRMLRFTATEKDCGPSDTTDGQPQECSICMEEYEVGDLLCRLECWCKFHEECIVSWFGRRAECPVHKIS